jgi:hypothetical protein
MRSSFSILILGLVVAGCAGRNVHPMGPASSRDDLAHRRSQQIQRLHDYRVAAVFPTDNRGLYLSVFRDQRGRPCPMAALIEQSGNRALVDRIVVENNQLRLADVHGGPLLDWMVNSGLTQEEVDLVQGALTIDEMRGMQQYFTEPTLTVTEQVILTARREIVRRLEDIEARLVAQTSHSLDVATTRLPRANHAAVASH